MPHFGLVLSVQQFHDLADKVQQAKVDFVIQPHLRFGGRRVVTEDVSAPFWWYSCLRPALHDVQY